ncbi:MAG: glycosyltransferase [Acidimicrobiia bacterium]|nr:glycosyltransferase [Acidimicrobiia bacterium]
MADRFSLSVVAPCLNEETNIPILAERLFGATEEAGIAAELVVVDDGSTDGTWAAVEAARDLYGSAVRGVRHEHNRGIPAAWRSGVDAAQGTYVCFIDGDLQNPPEEVVTLYRRLVESRYDIAQGTRSSIDRLRDGRLVSSRALNVLLNVLFGMRSADNKSGFVLGPRRVLDDVLEHKRRYRHFQTFIGVSAKAKGYSILEVETLFQNRNAGTSFLATTASKVSREVLLDFPKAFVEFGPLRRRAAAVNTVARRPNGPRPGHPYRGWRRLWFEAYFATMPAHTWLLRRRARELYLELKQTEWLSPNQMRELQLQKLQRMVQHAYVHVPYYREAMRTEGVAPEDIETLEDIARLPLLSKDLVRKNLYFDLFADNHRKRDMHKIATSGSTGEPFTTYADRHQLEVRFATTLRQLEWTGWRFGDRQARLWHQTLGMSRTQVVRERIDAMFMRRLFVPAFEMKPGNLESFIEKIRDHDPVLVDGYAESLNFLATFVREEGRPGFSPKAMMSSAQALPDNVKDTIEAGFNTRVFDKYGSREFSGIAYTCEFSDQHHVMDESYVVELLVDGRPAKPGEVGEVVITDLNNFSLPLIRYRIGDLAVAVDNDAPCECGRGMSRIGRIEGRTQAIVHCADGTWLPGTFFAHFFKDYEYAIRFFQIHQERKGAFTLKIVKNRQFTDQAFVDMLEQLRSYTGIDTDIEVDFVDEIPLVRTGKRSPVVSTVREDFQSVPTRTEEEVSLHG